jgi:O-antigen ligase
VPILQRWVVFLAGLFVEFNVLIGGQTEGAAATGGYGYRASDFICIVCVLLILTITYSGNRIFSAYVYAIGVIVIFAPVIALRNDYTVTIGIRYVVYSLSALFLASALQESRTMSWFCYGVIGGLVAAIGVFFLQNASISRSTLLSFGLIAGYANDYGGYIRDTPRYSGLWGHPNEAGHVGALAAAAGIYLYLVERKVLPLAVVCAGLLGFFYYTLSRGGLIAGGATIVIAVMIPKDGKILDARFLGGLAFVAIAALGVSQLDFLFSRFTNDQNASGNFAERLDTTLAGLQIALTHPLGSSLTDFVSELDSLTGGVGSPHNGFVLIGAVFGIAPLIVIVWAIANSFRIQRPTDVLFAYLALQICISNMFEQIPASIAYTFCLALLIANAFLKTQIGGALVPSPRLNPITD